MKRQSPGVKHHDRSLVCAEGQTGLCTLDLRMDEIIGMKAQRDHRQLGKHQSLDAQARPQVFRLGIKNALNRLPDGT